MLRFTSLTVENFGPFKGSQTIDFTKDDGVTFIWGDNGRGKTTLLNVFRYALYGKFQNRRGAEVNLTALSNIESRADGEYGFKVDLCMENDGKEYKLTRQYRMRAGVRKPTKNDDYEQLVFLNEDGAMLSGEALDHILKIIMPEEVARFFLFDGELLQEYEELIREGSEEGAKIKDSIERILGVPVLTNSATDAESVLEEYKMAKTRTAQSNQQTQQIGTQIMALDAEIQEHTAELNRLRTELTQERTKETSFQAELEQNNHVKDLLGNMKALETSIDEKKARQDAMINQINVLTKDAWQDLVEDRVSEVLFGIHEQVDELEKKANEYRIAQALLDGMRDAAASRHCHLCDQDIDEAQITALYERIKMAEAVGGQLSPEEKALLNRLQSRQAALQSMTFSSVKPQIEIFEQQLAETRVSISDDERRLREIKDELSTHGDIETLSETMQQNLKDLSQCMMKIENLEEGRRLENEKITNAKSTQAKLNDQLDKTATGPELAAARQRVELCEKILQIFEEGVGSYRDKLKSNVERDATDLFLRISNDPDYEKLEINENYGLNIKHISGETIPLRSAGFEHVIALSLIGALHKNAPLGGPVIMDSPFGRLDPTHKAKITEALPSLSEQIVLLAYTHEIDDQNARAKLGSVLKKEYRLTRQNSFFTSIEPQL